MNRRQIMASASIPIRHKSNIASNKLLVYLLVSLVVAAIVTILSTVNVSAIWNPHDEAFMISPLGIRNVSIMDGENIQHLAFNYSTISTPQNDGTTRIPPTTGALPLITTPPLIINVNLKTGERNIELGLVHPTTPELVAHLGNLSSQSMTSTAPWPNLTTMAFYEGRFRSGYRNQMMAFSMVVFATQHQGHGQLLLHSLAQKDTYGTNRFIPFAKLWDVPHWNSYHPTLPRLVDYDSYLHDQYNLQSNPPWFRNGSHFQNKDGTVRTNKPVRPHAFGKQHQLMAGYMSYAKGRGKYAATGGHRNPMEILMLQGALRPHRNLQIIIDEKLQQLLLELPNNVTMLNATSLPTYDYMTLHARVEPDMQRHPVCRDKKVLNLTDIFDFLESKWINPPGISKLFLPINRQYLEQEGIIDNNNNKKKRRHINWMAVENLKALNRARDLGLWNGRVTIHEFGAHSLQGTIYEKKPSTPGAMLNFFIGIQAKIFVGTEVSSYSHDLLATRLFRGYRDNYKYLPNGLFDWTPSHIHDPPGFNC